MSLSIFEGELLRQFADDYISEFKYAIENNKIARKTQRGTFNSAYNSSGSLANSGEYKLDNNELTILANYYLYWGIYGRNEKRTPPPISNIEQWIKEKGLNLNPWAVRNSIAKNGSSIFQQWNKSPSNLLETIPLDDLLNELQNKLGDRFIESLSTDLLKYFENDLLNIEL